MMSARRLWAALVVAVGAAAGFGQHPGIPTVAELRKAVDAGDPNAMLRLAARLKAGDGVPPDAAAATALVRRAADTGFSPAQHVLGRRYELGDGLPRSDDAAAEWYAKAAAQGLPAAVADLAALYATGAGLPADQKAAVARLDALVAQSPAVLRPNIYPLDSQVRCFGNLTTAYFQRTDDRQPGFDKVRAVLAKEAPDSAVQHTVEGRYLLAYAWDARSNKFASDVSADQFRLFKERLTAARTALERGWQADDRNYLAATSRISVAMGLGEKREVMEEWFTRAVKLNPSYKPAYQAKLTYLEPKWHGDKDGNEMVAFGRECLATGNWGTGVPLLAVSAHEQLSYYPRGDRREMGRTLDPAYFTQPGVWDDIRQVYEKYLTMFPTNAQYRSRYARLAAFCGRWAEAHRQFEKLGPNVVPSVFDSPDELDRLRKTAAGKGK